MFQLRRKPADYRRWRSDNTRTYDALEDSYELCYKCLSLLSDNTNSNKQFNVLSDTYQVIPRSTKIIKFNVFKYVTDRLYY